jgi:hypothetical protein
MKSNLRKHEVIIDRIEVGIFAEHLSNSGVGSQARRALVHPWKRNRRPEVGAASADSLPDASFYDQVDRRVSRVDSEYVTP